MPPKKKEIEYRSRQSKKMKRLETVNFAQESKYDLRGMRESIHMKSRSKGKNGLDQ